MAALAFHDVTITRGGRVLADALSFAVPEGGATLVTGPNGAGKSSLVRVAAGLLPPAAGRVEAMPCALLGEASALDGERTLAAALGFWGALDGVDVAPALAALGLDALATVPVRLLSTGQRRRAAIARVVASTAPLWLLDEPANGLDASAVALLEAVIAAHRAGGGAVLIATHLPLALPEAASIVLGAA